MERDDVFDKDRMRYKSNETQGFATIQDHRRLLIKKEFFQIVAAQRDYFDSGATASLSTRKVGLSTLKKLLEDNTTELAHAVEKDLHKKPGYTQMELLGCLGEIDYVTENLESWSATQYVSKTLLNAMDEPSLVRQPLGVVLIIGPWNYPLELVIRPLIPALAAGMS